MAVVNYQNILAAYQSALLALATAQSYTVLGKTVTKADLPEIRNTISWLEQKIQNEKSPDDALGIVQVTKY